MKVLKFGSSALASANRIKEIAKLVSKQDNANSDIIVLSAIGDTTTTLTDIADYLYKKNPDGAKELINNLEHKYLNFCIELFNGVELENIKSEISEKFDNIRNLSKDIFTLFEEKEIVAQGELLISFIFTKYLISQGIDAKYISALNFMKIDKNDEPDTQFIKDYLKKELENVGSAKFYITEGFICKNAYNEIDNLGKGGSDYSAALIGAAIGAKEIQFWSDKNGIYNNDFEVVNEATPIAKLSFDEAAELSYFGNGDKIIHPTCILPAKLENIPVRLMNILQPQACGTLISTDFTANKIEAIAAKDGITTIKISSGRMLFAHGFLRRISEIFETYKTPIDVITTSEVGVSLTIDNNKHLEEIIDDLKKFGTVSFQKDMVLVCIVGDLSEGNIGFQAKIFNALKNLPIRMISYGGSYNNISLLVKASDKSNVLKSLHKELF